MGRKFTDAITTEASFESTRIGILRSLTPTTCSFVGEVGRGTCGEGNDNKEKPHTPFI